MNIMHLHLALNHVPIVGIFIGTVVLLFSLFFRSSQTKRVALIMIVACSALSIPVYLSGEPTEHIVERTVQLNESVIENHEEAAELSFGLSIALGLAAGFALWSSRKAPQRLDQRTGYALIVLSVACSASLLWTGYLGGQIRHTELLASALPNANTDMNAGANAESGEANDDDDAPQPRDSTARASQTPSQSSSQMGTPNATQSQNPSHNPNQNPSMNTRPTQTSQAPGTPARGSDKDNDD